MIFTVFMVGAVILGTGLLMLIRVFPTFGGKAVPVVLLLIGLGITAYGYVSTPE
jgi:hypothetical protein